MNILTHASVTARVTQLLTVFNKSSFEMDMDALRSGMVKAMKEGDKSSMLKFSESAVHQWDNDKALTYAAFGFMENGKLLRA